MSTRFEEYEREKRQTPPWIDPDTGAVWCPECQSTEYVMVGWGGSYARGGYIERECENCGNHYRVAD